jgi:type I restriction enzyme S subunit
MQKIFSQEIRFKRDDGGEFEDWKLTSIGDFLNERVIYPTEKLPLYSLTIENGIIPKSARYERSFLVKKDDAYKLMQKNDFAFNPMNLRFGALARHKENCNVMVSKYYNIFYCNEKLIPKFAEEYFTTYNSIQFYNKMATGTLEEKKRVHYKDFLKFRFLFPQKEEQNKIATFLTSIDQKITQTIQALEQMKRFKKGLLQGMFV